LVDWEKTSLKPYVDLLDKHALSLMEEVRKEKRKTGNSLSAMKVFFFDRRVDQISRGDRKSPNCLSAQAFRSSKLVIDLHHHHVYSYT
jgi:hypothetical protein